MKIYSWNIWSGSLGEAPINDLRRFVTEEADIICLQEVHRAPQTVPRLLMPNDPGSRIAPLNSWLYQEIVDALGEGFAYYYAPQLKGCYHDCERAPYPELEYGNLLIIKRELRHTYRSGFICGNIQKLYNFKTGSPAGKTAQVVDVYDANGVITIGHGHGAWANGNKGNTAWRNSQAINMLKLLDPHYSTLRQRAAKPDYYPRTLLVGDWNVTSSTRTVRRFRDSQVFGKSGGEHLNAKWGITDTRTCYYQKPIREADHAFASANLKANLTVDVTVASDHGALLVSFES